MPEFVIEGEVHATRLRLVEPLRCEARIPRLILVTSRNLLRLSGSE
jgi:hypothetical protein